jgi:replicative DNA helicase|tara:strand:+ start:8464 stop:10044 length:1581 start_codon:yes stop_codon:yes gene_type:complete
MLNSKELEKQLLSCLMQYPSSYGDIAGLIDESDFYVQNGSFVHRTIFRVIKNILSNANAEALDDVVIIERLKSANISFVDNIDVGDYVRSLLLKKVSSKAAIGIAKELKNLSAKRGIKEICEEISSQVKNDPEPNLTEVVRKYDKLYNDQINLLCKEDVKPENIYEDLPDVIEDLADNPRDPGFLAPHMPRTNSMYGSLARPGNITVICARTGVGKTTFCIDFVTKMSKEHGLPVLHFDNGEMSKLELQMRQCSAISGVPMYLIESGKWRSSSYIDPITRQEVSEEETRQKVYQAFEYAKGMRFDYYNVGGLTCDEMLQIAKRYYYSQIGRGNSMLFSYDYIKATNQNDQNKASWQFVADFVDKCKNMIHKEITHNGRPLISMITSVQSNRSGITANRHPDAIVDDESIVSLSDQITQFASHLFILRPRLPRELQIEPDSYAHATHRLKCIKNRHLGEDRLRASEPVLIPAIDDDGQAVGNDRPEQNCIFLRMDNFGVEEVGDLRDMAEQMRVNGITPDEDGDFDL